MEVAGDGLFVVVDRPGDGDGGTVGKVSLGLPVEEVVGGTLAKTASWIGCLAVTVARRWLAVRRWGACLRVPREVCFAVRIGRRRSGWTCF